MATTTVDVPNLVKQLSKAARACRSATSRSQSRHDAFTKQFEASYPGPDKAALAIGALLLPEFPAKQTRGHQNGVADCGTRALVLQWQGVLASRDNRLPPTFRNRFMTAFGVVGTIAADGGDDLTDGNLVEQAAWLRQCQGEPCATGNGIRSHVS